MKVARKVYLIDAKGATLGRLATRVAMLLQGKDKPDFAYHTDTGYSVIVVNAKHIVLTGRKMGQKKYFKHSGYPGGTTFTLASDMIKKDPQEMVRHAVKGMLPKNRLAARMITRLKIYSDETHPHASQKPEAIGWKI